MKRAVPFPPLRPSPQGGRGVVVEGRMDILTTLLDVGFFAALIRIAHAADPRDRSASSIRSAPAC